MPGPAEVAPVPPDKAGVRLVRAAGCVLWRRAAGGGVEIAVVHRPRWDDWSHPKGKLKRGEPARDAAIREVREETGVVCALGAPLTIARYLVRGQPKQVDYWVAEALSGDFEPNDEVDRVLWLTPAEARTWLTQPRDAELVDEALAALAKASPEAPSGTS